MHEVRVYGGRPESRKSKSRMYIQIFHDLSLAALSLILASNHVPSPHRGYAPPLRVQRSTYNCPEMSKRNDAPVRNTNQIGLFLKSNRNGQARPNRQYQSICPWKSRALLVVLTDWRQRPTRPLRPPAHCHLRLSLSDPAPGLLPANSNSQSSAPGYFPPHPLPLEAQANSVSVQRLPGP